MYRIFKRAFDFTFSLVLLVCLSPFLLVITFWLHFANKGAGAFFQQPRPGKDEKIFNVIKFKSMTDERMNRVICCLMQNDLPRWVVL